MKNNNISKIYVILIEFINHITYNINNELLILGFGQMEYKTYFDLHFFHMPYNKSIEKRKLL